MSINVELRTFFYRNSTTNRPWQCCLGWNDSQVYQLPEISFIGRQENKSYECDTGCVLMFISMLSLRMEGGRERGRGDRGREERIVPLTGLALCVMNGAVTDGDRFVFNTCGCTIRSASPDKPGAFLSRWSPNGFISGCLWWTRSLSAGAHRLLVPWKQKCQKYGIVLVQIHLIIYLLDQVKCRNPDWPFSWETFRCLSWPS